MYIVTMVTCNELRPSQPFENLGNLLKKKKISNFKIINSKTLYNVPLLSSFKNCEVMDELTGFDNLSNVNTLLV